MTARRPSVALAVRVYLTVFALLACAWMPASARAEPEPFRFAPKLELPLLGVGGLGWLLSEQFKEKLAPAECRACGANALDEAGQRGLRWENHLAAARTSDWMLFGVVPTAALAGAGIMALREGTPKTALVDVIVVLEALVLTANLTQLTKLSVGRARPYVATRRREGLDPNSGPDDNLSFFSGHSSATFAMAVAAGMTATLRGYRAAPVMWAVGVPLAAFTGYLRLAADRHYLSDVLTGALIGSAVGVLLPFLHARNAQRGAPMMSVSPPATLNVTWMR